MELHDLAGVVLVRMAGFVHLVVQVASMAGLVAEAREHVRKASERVLADHLQLVGGGEVDPRPFAGVDVEVVRPEVDHPLVELVRAVDRSGHGRLLHQLKYVALVDIAQLRGMRGQDLLVAVDAQLEAHIIRAAAVQLLFYVTGRPERRNPFDLSGSSGRTRGG